MKQPDIEEDVEIVEVDPYKDYPWYKRIYYKLSDFIFDITPLPLYHFYKNWLSVKTWYLKIKFLTQRMSRGFDDTETYSLDYSLYEWLLPRLKRFIKLNNGWPEHYESFENWQNEIQKRIEQLEYIVEYKFEGDSDYQTELEDFNEWLSKNINHLWW